MSGSPLRLLLLALCKSGADGPSFLSLPPSLESHTLKGYSFFFSWTVGQTGVCRRFLSCHQIPELFTGLCHCQKWPFLTKPANRKPVVILRFVSLSTETCPGVVVLISDRQFVPQIVDPGVPNCRLWGLPESTICTRCAALTNLKQAEAGPYTTGKLKFWV